MKYFKPELISNSDIAREEWSASLKKYGEYISRLLPSLSDEMQEYVGLTDFHDEAIGAVEHDKSTNSLTLEVGHRSVLKFAGVSRVDFEGQSLAATIGDVWLYDEVERLGNNRFEFRILLEGGQLTIGASNVSLD